MGRLGLVSSIEAQLERMIGAGMLPESGQLPSEQTLARRFDVSRTTIREAMGRLAARGLVVQRAGRKTRAVALDESVTLENLGVALHGEGRGHPDRRLLLEGYFTLKREATLELLAACREHAFRWEMQRLGDACFALMEAARWEGDCVAREFELLRLAARVARRPGHLLLIQSLERAWWGIQARVRPHLDARAVYQWAYRAFCGLDETDPSVLKRELLPLLRTCDERVLERLAPVHEVKPPDAEKEPAGAALSGSAVPNLSACRTGSCGVAPEEASPPGPAPTGSCGGPERSVLEARGPLPDAAQERASASSRECCPPRAPDGLLTAEPGADTTAFTPVRPERRQEPPFPIRAGRGGALPSVAEAPPPPGGPVDGARRERDDLCEGTASSDLADDDQGATQVLRASPWDRGPASRTRKRDSARQSPSLCTSPYLCSSE